jgi:nucleoside-diphosphate-sugar epimerase
VRVLVTGAVGPLGREVVTRLGPPGWSGRRGLVADMTGVVHAAAIPAPTLEAEQEILSNNVISAYQVPDAAGRGGVRRIVHVSSLPAIGSPTPGTGPRRSRCR